MAAKRAAKRPSKKATPFTEVEDFYVKAHVGQKTAAEIAVALGRSEAEVAERLVAFAEVKLVEAKRQQLATLQPRPGITTITQAHSKLADDTDKATRSEGGQAFLDQYKNCIAPAFPDKK